LLAGIDLVTGKVHALAKDRHRSCEFIEFLKLLDAAYQAHSRASSPNLLAPTCVISVSHPNKNSRIA
jgi:hypothetical protein